MIQDGCGGNVLKVGSCKGRLDKTARRRWRGREEGGKRGGEGRAGGEVEEEHSKNT